MIPKDAKLLKSQLFIRQSQQIAENARDKIPIRYRNNDHSPNTGKRCHGLTSPIFVRYSQFITGWQ